jgi:pyruvate/2-oxoglutarate dehydrogenase complex dihydrolipoamide acyltransferase (E2) component
LADGNIDVRSVRGSGVGGTITRRDAEAAVAKGPSGEQAVALTSVQRRMAEHLSAASQSTPQGFVAVEIDARIIDLVDALGGQTRDGIEISDEALVALAAIRAITEFPSLNATFAVTEIVQHYAVNIGFVRDVTSDGIAVPVIHAASQLSLAALVRCLADLDERLANNLLVTEDLMGGTFTVHAAPSANTVLVQPLLLPGQTAILSMGSARHVPIVERIDGVRSIVAGRRMTLGLAFDYRVLDAVVAAKFLERVGEILQTINLDTER